MVPKVRTNMDHFWRPKYKIFHTLTLIRRQRNPVQRLIKADGEWRHDNITMKNMACDYFQNLFSLEFNSGLRVLSSAQFPKQGETNRIAISRPFTQEEVHQAIFNLNPYKAPGPNGYQPLFYQKLWYIVGGDVSIEVLHFLNHNLVPV